MVENVRKTIWIDEHVLDSLTTSMVDDVFYVLQSCPRLQTLVLSSVIAVLSNAVSLLANDYHEALQQTIIEPNLGARSYLPVFLTINSDFSYGAWKPGILAAGVAWSFYNTNGEIITSHSNLISYVNSPLVAEGLAMREAMDHALSLGFNRVIFESDSKQLISTITDGACFSEIHGIASDITLLSNLFPLGFVIASLFL
uniref:Uncharacterized protein n=1 Tax=Brassica oleracea var. oleracea TaxID=109376 RepID=A0A0D2ZR43_BRAOL